LLHVAGLAFQYRYSVSEATVEEAGFYCVLYFPRFISL